MSENLPLRPVAASWDALEDAFENNAPEVHSYLHLDTGEVIRLVDGVADPSLHSRIVSDANYLRIDPVSSREQYRWMERFIATVEDAELRHKLFRAIDGKGAFRRFKDVLMTYPVDRERWFAFRSERVRACMESWLTTHSLRAIERPEWSVPSAEEVQSSEETHASQEEGSKEAAAPERNVIEDDFEPLRLRLMKLAESLPSYDLEIATSFLEFLTERSFARRSTAPRGSSPGIASVQQPDIDTKVAAAPAAPKAEEAPAAPKVETKRVVTRVTKKTSKAKEKASAAAISDGVLFASQLPPDPSAKPH